LKNTSNFNLVIIEQKVCDITEMVLFTAFDVLNNYDASIM